MQSRRLYFIISLLSLLPFLSQAQQLASFTFPDSDKKFSDNQKKTIEETVVNTVKDFSEMFELTKTPIKFTIHIIERDLSDVYGVTGRADKPDEIEISISSTYAGGLNKAIMDGLKATVFHELHHTIRGWTIHGNKFPRGIDVAAINEGLADVFAELQVGRPLNKLSTDINYHEWANEVIALPQNANYGHWMFMHPDGRTAIGYRLGAYLVKRAMENSQLDIFELSKLSIAEIYQHAGYEYKHK